jgi:hypothetical protein
MEWNNQLSDIARFCFSNKITLTIRNQAEMNSAYYENDGKHTNFIICICNEKDGKLKKIIEEGFDNLKNFVNKGFSE